MFVHSPGDFEVGQLNTSSQRSGDGEAVWTTLAAKTAYDPVVRHAPTTGQATTTTTQAVIARSSDESAILRGTATVLA